MIENELGKREKNNTEAVACESSPAIDNWQDV